MENGLLKKASEELLKIADAIEKEASEKIFFACGSCDHTVNLETINAKRKEAVESLKDSGNNIVIASISVEDKIRCSSCEDGVMVYAATEESEKYLVDASELEGPQEYDSLEAGKAPEKSEEDGKEEVEEEKKEVSEEGENPFVKKASELGLDLDAVARYSDL